MGDYNGKVDAGPPPKGAAVDGIWTDDKNHDGHCESVTYRKLNNVFFCDGTRGCHLKKILVHPRI